MARHRLVKRGNCNYWAEIMPYENTCEIKGFFIIKDTFIKPYLPYFTFTLSEETRPIKIFLGTIFMENIKGGN